MKKLILFLVVLAVGLSIANLPLIAEEITWQWVLYKGELENYKFYLQTWPSGRYASVAHARVDRINWKNALAENTVAGYENYLQNNPDGRYVNEAKRRIEKFHWQDSLKENSVEAFERYLQLYPNGQYAAEARSKLDEFHWQEAVATNTVGSYERYLQLYPNGKHVAEAQDKLDTLHWQEAQNKDTLESYQEYLQLQPNGKYISEALSRIDDFDWQEATAVHTTQSYQTYLDVHPDGKYVDQALEELHWQEAVAGNVTSLYERYLRLHPDGKYVTEAESQLDALRWQQATSANTIRAYQDYMRQHPNGAHLLEAEANITALRSDPAPYEQALQKGTLMALQQFLTNYPGHEMEEEARLVLQEIKEGRDLVSLLEEKKVEIETEGNGLTSVIVRVRRLVPYQLTVRVPVGTLFVPARSGVQNMVVTSEEVAQLKDDGWTEVSVATACANMALSAPDSEDYFPVIRRSPYQPELATVLPILEEADPSYDVLQAAIWIITDNATYEELGILVSCLPFILDCDVRAIEEEEAAQALQLLAEAGIDITQKRIWADRNRILQGLPEGELKSWLENFSQA
ncbi:MAG: hypothetical protein D6706_16840 [Chloroflexi bacterium]|nr:MAG: hypothetical protein D6706_16840 [Chloroflexota bacterium]